MAQNLFDWLLINISLWSFLVVITSWYLWLYWISHSHFARASRLVRAFSTRSIQINDYLFEIKFVVAFVVAYVFSSYCAFSFETKALSWILIKTIMIPLFHLLFNAVFIFRWNSVSQYGSKKHRLAAIHCNRKPCENI